MLESVDNEAPSYRSSMTDLSLMPANLLCAVPNNTFCVCFPGEKLNVLFVTHAGIDACVGRLRSNHSIRTTSAVRVICELKGTCI